MDAFWNWMTKKGYNKHRTITDHYNPMNNGDAPTKQMLIGYMIEYLAEKDTFIIMLREKTFSDKYFESIEDYYDRLEKAIEQKFKDELAAEELK